MKTHEQEMMQKYSDKMNAEIAELKSIIEQKNKVRDEREAYIKSLEGDLEEYIDAYEQLNLRNLERDNIARDQAMIIARMSEHLTRKDFTKDLNQRMENDEI